MFENVDRWQKDIDVWATDALLYYKLTSEPGSGELKSQLIAEVHNADLHICSNFERYKSHLITK